MCVDYKIGQIREVDKDKSEVSDKGEEEWKGEGIIGKGRDDKGGEGERDRRMGKRERVW